MTRIIGYLVLSAGLALGAAQAIAQEEEDNGGFLERLIEDALSGDDRDVVIRGFEGLLSGRARFETMTISDADGVWLTVTDAELDWNRLALLRSRLVVSNLTAGSVDLARPPLPANEPPAPEAASGFALPDLPVSVRIDEIGVAELSLGEALFGQAATMSVAGSALLEGGEGQVELQLDRLDGQGTFSLSGNYANATDVLALNLLVDEAADGIVANLIDLPGLPSLRLEVSGEGPLSDYAADISLATDGADRLGGRVTLTTSGEGEAVDRSFTAALTGDVTPLFLPEYQDFFGDALELSVAGTRRASGVLEIEELDLVARSLTLTGAVTLGPERLPVFIDVDAAVADPGGDAVVLPVPGEPISLQNATLAVTFDAADGERWDAQVAVSDLQGAGYSVADITLDGGGAIQPVSPNRGLTAAFVFLASDADLGDDAVDAALGEDVRGSARLAWTEGQPLLIEELDIQGQDYGVTAQGQVSGFGEGLDLDIDATAEARNLAAFSGLARRDLGGSISVDATVSVEALTGQAAAVVTGSSRDLIVDQPEADRVLAGTADFEIWAVRDENGTRLERFVVVTPHAEVTASADLKTGASEATFDARLNDTGLVIPELTGPSSVVAEASQSGDLWTFRADAGLPESFLRLSGTGDLGGDVPRIDTEVDGALNDLSRFSTLAGRTLGGSVSVSGRIEGLADLSGGLVDLTGTARDLVIGQAQADALLAGVTDFEVKAGLVDTVPTVEVLRIDGQTLDLTGSGSLAPGAGLVDLTASISDTAVVLPGTQGPFRLTARANETDDQVWQFDIDSDGALAALRAEGTATPFANPVAIDASVDLSAPDLSAFSALAGRPLAGTASLSGTVAGVSDLSKADVDLAGRLSGISTGIAEVDRLLAGRSDIVVDAGIDGDAISLRNVRFNSSNLKLAASGDTTGGSGRLELSASLADLGLFVPSFPGPVSIGGSATLRGGSTLTLDLDGTGPGGISASVDGDVRTDTRRLDLRVRGNAPLALANRFTSPNSLDGTVAFDLDVDGPPALGSVSGKVTTSSARLVLPGPRISFQNIAVDTTLSRGRANVNVNAAVEAGGTVSVSGPVTLSPPFSGALDVALNSVVLIDPTLYRTVISGNLGVDGPLAGGATIAGNLRVGETEINIAGTGAGAAGAIPEIDHLNEPFDVHQTRRFAGLVRDERGARGSGGPVYPLDVAIDVQRVFVRGRGLDTELAGGLRIRGTTANVVPVGEIDLIRGRLNILGARLRVDEGAILLQGALVPALRLRAVSERRTTDDVTAFVSIEGPVTDPEITFESEPPLPEDEVLARLLFGTDLANISALQAAQLAGAAATLAGGGGPDIVGGIRDGLGIDDLDVTTDEEGNTAVTAGAYLSEDLYADVTTRSNGETEINLNYDLTNSIRVTGSSDSTGESSIGIFFQRDY